MIGMGTVGIALAGLAMLLRGDAGVDTVVRWCRDRIVAAAGSREDALVSVAVALGAVAMAFAAARLFAFIIGEVAARSSFERSVRASIMAASRNVRIAAAEVCADVHVSMVHDRRPFAVSVGLLRPKIVVSSALAARCTLSELRAVLAHEAAHCRAGHPLRAFAWECIRRASVLAPTADDVVAHFSLARELEADAAAQAVAGRRALVSAMLKTVDFFPVRGCAAFGQLGDRAQALAVGGHAPLRLRSGRLALTLCTALCSAFLSGTLHVRAASVPALCADDSPAMSMVNFSPYLSFSVAPRDPQMSTAPPQSHEVPLMDIAR